MEKTNQHPTKPLDKIDRQMVNLLQKDGRMPIVMIAKKLNIAKTTARSRLKKLIDKKIVDIVAVCNPISLGFQIISRVQLSIDLKKQDAIIDSLKKIDAVNYIALTTGGTHLDIEFIGRSLDEFKSLLFDTISQIDGVISAESSLIVDIAKGTWDYGTAWDVE